MIPRRVVESVLSPLGAPVALANLPVYTRNPGDFKGLAGLVEVVLV
jgi:hypothetical protein